MFHVLNIDNQKEESILCFYSRETRYCCDVIKQLFGNNFAIVKCADLRSQDNKKIFVGNESLVVMLWENGCGQLEERKILTGLDFFLETSTTITPPQQWLLVGVNNVKPPIFDYLVSCGAWVTNINSVFTSILKALNSTPGFTLGPVVQESTLGHQIADGYYLNNRHGECWRDVSNLQHIVPWLTG